MLEAHRDWQTHGALGPVPSNAECIEALGTPRFHGAFREYLLAVSGANYFAFYHAAGDTFYDVSAGGGSQGEIACRQAKLYADGGFWRHDPALAMLWETQPDGHPVVSSMRIDHIEHSEMRNRIYRPYLVCDRIVISARLPHSAVAISLMRTERRGPFSADDVATIDSAADGIVALAMKHVALENMEAKPLAALTSLSTIKACLAKATPALARREAEVCAGVLYGMTSMGIALELGISEESAMTYRKRSYSRLKIGSQRELLLWYLDQWSRHRMDVDLPH